MRRNVLHRLSAFTARHVTSPTPAVALLSLATAAGCVASTDASAPPGQSTGQGGSSSAAAGGTDPMAWGGAGNAPPVSGGSGNVATTGGAGNTGPTGGTGNAGPTGGTGNVPPTGGASSSGGTGSIQNSGGTPGTGATEGVGGFGLGGNGGFGEAGGPGVTFDAGTDPSRNRVAAGQVCDRLATIQCAGEAACCISPGRTFDQCKTAQVAECQNDFFLDAVSLNSVSGYGIDAAEAAFAEFEGRASRCDPSIAAWGISPSGLRGITQGTFAAGSDCTPPIGFDAAIGAAYLASCTSGATQACLPGGIAGTTWTCAPRGSAGSKCFSDLNCADGHYCPNFSNPPALTGSSCVARKADGSPCTYSQECLTLTCEGGTCAQATSQTAYCLL